MPSSKSFRFCFLWISLYILPSVALGSIPVNEEDYRTGSVSMSSLVNPSIVTTPSNKQDYKHFKKTQKQNKRIAKIEKKLSAKLAKKSFGSIDDPEDRWFWIFSISWGVGILITLISGATIVAPGIGFLWFLSFTFGAVALIIWLRKRFA